MTTKSATATLAPPSDSLLRVALRLDATVTGLLGLALAAAAGPASTLTGFTPTQEYVVGAALVLYGVVVYRLAGVRSVRRAGRGRRCRGVGHPAADGPRDHRAGRQRDLHHRVRGGAVAGGEAYGLVATRRKRLRRVFFAISA